jgi:hypothetical protein
MDKINNVFKYLDVSTGHITENDARLLQAYFDSTNKFNTTLEPIGVYPIGIYNEGFVLSLTNIDESEVLTNYSSAFYKLMQYARNHGCSLVRLDADAGFIEGLPQFNY